MRNITLAVDEDVLAQVRKYAAQTGTSVNAIVREHLARLARQADEAQQARSHRELMRLIDSAQGEVGPITWTRDDLHARDR